ncbi:MAG TPA: hypothetical protein VK616_10655 [Flavitalea sp.]|nr:hypothetical protein [Flavitalea sp.]
MLESAFNDVESGEVVRESGELCIGALESAEESSGVELSVQDAMIDVIAIIAKNFFILDIILG